MKLDAIRRPDRHTMVECCSVMDDLLGIGYRYTQANAQSADPGLGKLDFAVIASDDILAKTQSNTMTLSRFIQTYAA